MQCNTTKKLSYKQRMTFALGVVILLFGSGAFFFTCSPGPAPDPENISPSDAVKFAASKQFSRLSVAEQNKYFDQMRRIAEKDGNPFEFFRKQKLSEAESAQLRENMGRMFRRHMEEQNKKLLAMTPAEREKEYDRMAEEIKKHLADGKRPGPPPEGGPDQMGMMKGIFEGTSSDSRAMMAETMKAMKKRLPPPPEH